MKAIRRLFIFNPEHDMALAVGNGPYTPPAEIIKIKNSMALLPAYFAGNSDFILIPSEISEKQIVALPYFEWVDAKKISLVKKEELANISPSLSEVVPWGWDHAIRNLLADSGIEERLLPNQNYLKKIRELSHRRTVLPFRDTIARLSGRPEKYKACELFSINEVEDFLNQYPLAFFKAPWSSSGRGIVVSDHISKKGLLEWAHGTLRRQGSIIAEPSWNKVLDFATEWWIKDHKAHFLGFSVFEASSRGKYHRNLRLPQDRLLKIIKDKVPAFLLDIPSSSFPSLDHLTSSPDRTDCFNSRSLLEIQRIAIDTHISPHYSGPLGIDLLADSSGDINPCVEINLRFTMGLIEIINKP